MRSRSEGRYASASTHRAALNAESARDHLGNVKLIRLGNEDRDSFSFEARHDLAKPERKCGREALERLVEQQHASARHEGARKRDHLLLASRQLDRAPRSKAQDLGHDGKNPGEPLLGAIYRSRPRWQADILLYREFGNQ